MNWIGCIRGLSMFCPRCGKELPDAGHCPACGQTRPTLDAPRREELTQAIADELRRRNAPYDRADLEAFVASVSPTVTPGGDPGRWADEFLTRWQHGQIDLSRGKNSGPTSSGVKRGVVGCLCLFLGPCVGVAVAYMVAGDGNHPGFKGLAVLEAWAMGAFIGLVLGAWAAIVLWSRGGQG